MFCLNHRIGILFRQNLTKKSYELRYFFIDDNANLFYIVSLSKLQKIIRISKNFEQISKKLISNGEKSLNLNKYTVNNPKNYTTQAVLPFSNRTCIDLKQKQAKSDERTYQIFGLADQDTPLLYDEILVLTGRKKKTVPKRKSIIEQQKQKQEKMPTIIFENFRQNQQMFSMPTQKIQQTQNKSQQPDNQYAGEKVNDLAEGKGKQILISKGFTFNGHFHRGKKHGVGYLVNQNLDTLQCQFIDDKLAGI